MKLIDFYKDKVVLITGASMGIGKELARQILGYGGKVVITGRNEQRLQSVFSDFNSYADNLLLFKGDVSNYEENKELIEKVILRFGKLDVLINNAGMSAFGEVEKINYHVVNEIIDTNIKGSLFPTMAAFTELKKTKGSVIFISSVASFRGLPTYSLYSLSKMALTALVQSLRIEAKHLAIFIGIAYVGFTENETAKRTISAEGKLEQVPTRNKLVTRSRQTTAKIILNQIATKRKRVIHSPVGKITYFLSKYMPSLMNTVYALNYENQRKKES